MKFNLLIILFASSLAFANCETEMAPGTTFSAIQAFTHFLNGRRPPEAELKVFWKEGLPYLKELADNSGTSVSGLLADYVAMVELSMDVLSKNPAAAETFKHQIKVAVLYLDKIDALVKKDKLKANTWNQLAMIHYAITVLAYCTVINESYFRTSPSMNPYGIIDSSYIRRLFNSLEESNLEQLERIEYRIRTSGQPEFKLELQYELPTTKPALTQEHGTVPPEPRVAADFMALIKGEGRIDPANTYFARTVHGRDLSITISDSIAEEFEGSERRPILKLLRGIIFARGDSSGIKALPDLGKHIVELKAVMNGHKRIFGCLEGTALKLLKFTDIGTTKAAYFKKIPHDLCH